MLKILEISDEPLFSCQPPLSGYLALPQGYSRPLNKGSWSNCACILAYCESLNLQFSAFNKGVHYKG